MRSLARFLLKFTLFSLIFQLEIFLQSSALFMLLGLAFWVLLLVIFTSPLWIPLSIFWVPPFVTTYLVFRYTLAGEKLLNGLETLFYFLMYTHQASGGGGGWLRTQIWRAIYNAVSWYLGKDSKLASYNCGYALLTQSGETIVFSNKADKYH